jgi:hypothetical protein
MSTFKTAIEQDEIEVPIVVRYQFHRALEGSRDGYRGLKLEPDEPAHIEIYSIDRIDGLPLVLSPAEEAQISEWVGEEEADRQLPQED